MNETTEMNNTTDEFSLEGFTAYYNLKWSKPRLAKNCNWYRKCEPTPEFWDWYNGEDDDPDYRKKQKEFLKQHGISIYKEYDKWGLFDWNCKERGTKEEYAEQQKSRDGGLRELLLIRLTEQAAAESPAVFNALKKDMERCETAEDLMDYAKYEIVRGEYICKEAQHEYSLL